MCCSWHAYMYIYVCPSAAREPLRQNERAGRIGMHVIVARTPLVRIFFWRVGVVTV